MIERTLTIENKLGLHARAASAFVKVAGSFASKITVSNDTRSADGKSIMSMMMLQASYQTQIQVSAEGDDAQDALDAISKLLADRFGEEE